MIKLADGRVVIDVVLEDGTVKKGVANLDKSLNGISGAGKRAAAGIKEIVTSLGLVALATKAIDMVKNSLDGAISRYDTLNNFPRVLQQLGFDATSSQKAIQRLSDGIQGLPTTLDDVAKNAQRLAIMTGDLDGAVETTLALNNAFISSGSSSADASRGLEQYVQMLSTGTVDLAAWRTLQETMGVALNDTAKAFGFAGKSAQRDLYDALKKGQITFDEFNTKLVELSNNTGGFADRALTASGGIRTAFTNMGTATVRGVTNIISSIDKVLANTSFQSLENIINNSGKRIFGLLDWIAKSILVVAEALEPYKPLLVGLATAFGTLAVSLLIAGLISSVSAAFTTLSGVLNGTIVATTLLQKSLLFLAHNPIVLVVAALAGLAAMFGYLWKTNEGFRNAMINTWSKIQEVFAKASQSAKELVQSLGPLWEAMKSKAIIAFNNSMSWLASTAQKAAEYLIRLKESIDVREVLGAVVGPLTTIATLFLGLASPIGWLIKGFALLSSKTSLFTDILSVFKGEMSIGQMVNNFAGDLTRLITSVAETASQLIEKGAELIAGFVQAISDNLPRLFDIGVQIITTVIGGIVNAVALILPVAVQIIGTIINTIVSLLPMLLELGLMIIVTLIDAIVTALPILIEVGIKIINTLIETIVSLIPMLAEVIVQLVETIITTIITMLPMLVETYITITETLIDTIVTALPMLIEAIMELIMGIIYTILDNLFLIADAGIQVLLALIAGIISILPSLLKAIFTIVKAVFDLIIQNLPMILGAGIRILQALISGIISILPSLISAAITLIAAILNTIFTNLPKILSAGVKILMALISGIIQILPQLIAAAIRLVLEIASAILRSLPQILAAGGQILWALIKGIIQLLPQLIKTAADLVGGVGKAIIGAVPKMVSAGKDLIKGLWNGIQSVKSWILGKIGGFVDSVMGGIKNFFGIASPSKRMRDEIGKWLPAGIGVGIERNEDAALDSVKDLAKNLTDEAQIDLGVTNRLRGIKTPLNGLIPSLTASGGYGGMNSHDNSKTFSPQINNYFTPAESTPSENTREQEKLLQRLGLQFG